MVEAIQTMLAEGSAQRNDRREESEKGERSTGKKQ